MLLLSSHHVSANIVRQTAVIHASLLEIRVSLKHLSRLIKCLDQGVQGVAAVRDLLGLTQRVRYGLVVVDPHVEIVLKRVLRLANQEEADLLRNRVAHVPHDESVVGVDLLTEVPYESVTLGRRLDPLLRRLLLLLVRVLVRVLLSDSVGDLLFLRVKLRLLEVEVVGEVVVQLSVDNGFNQVLGVIAQFLQDLHDDIHHDRSQAGEAHEDPVNDLMAETLQLGVNVIKAVEGRVSQLLELGLNQIIKHVDRGEPGNGVTLVHNNSAFNHHICVLLSRLHLIQVSVKLVEAHLNASTSGELLALGTALSVDFAAGIVLATDLVLISLDELCDHVPQQVHLLCLAGWQGGSERPDLLFCLFLLFFDLLDDFRQTVLNVHKKNL